MAFNKDSINGTLVAALLISLVCGIVVSTAAISLRPMQEDNRALDRQTNILMAAGLYSEGIDVPKVFDDVERRYIELGTAEETEKDSDYDQRAASQDPEQSRKLKGDEDIASVRTLPDVGELFLVRDDDDEIETIVIPVQGYGLWSTMYGFLSLESDADTIKGIVFYEHGETPGLGGEIDNKRWQATWEGKKLLSDAGDLKFELVKGSASNDNQVDGLSGATLTSKGVTNMVHFWVGDSTYGPYLEKLRDGKVE